MVSYLSVLGDGLIWRKKGSNGANKSFLTNSLEKYQNLIKLNNLIEKKFQMNIREINEKTKEKLSKINHKKS